MLVEIQDEIDRSIAPQGVGRMPGNMTGRLARLTAAELKTFAGLFMQCCFRNRLEGLYLALVEAMSRMCRLLELFIISTEQVNPEKHSSVVDIYTLVLSLLYIYIYILL